MLRIDAQKIDLFRSQLTAQGKQPATVSGYASDMDNFLDFMEATNLDSSAISLNSIEEFKGWLFNRGAKPSSVRRAIIGIRLFFRWLEKNGELHGNPFDESVVPAHSIHEVRKISESTIELMLSKTMISETSIKSARDAAMLLMLSREGLKSTEIVNLRWSDFFAIGTNGRLTISGDRARTISLEVETCRAIKVYRQVLIDDLRTKHEFSSGRSFFVSFKGADARSVQFGITRHGLKFAIYEMGRSAGLLQLNAEQLRHVAIMHKLNLGFSPEMLMAHLGLRRIGNIGRHLDSPVAEVGV